MGDTHFLKCKILHTNMGFEIVYGDTDSLFIHYNNVAAGISNTAGTYFEVPTRVQQTTRY